MKSACFFSKRKTVVALTSLWPAYGFAQTEDSGWDFSQWGLLLTILVTLLIIFILIILRNRKDPKKEAVRQKIENLKASGQELHISREEPLTKEDRELIRKQFKTMFIIAAAVLGVIGLGFQIPMEIIFSVVGLVILGLIYPIHIYMRHMQDEIYKKGTKLITRGIITEHYTTTTGSGKSRNTNYWISIGERKFKVTAQLYNRYNLGDAAEFHSVDNHKENPMIIRDEKLEGAGVN